MYNKHLKEKQANKNDNSDSIWGACELEIRENKLGGRHFYFLLFEKCVSNTKVFNQLNNFTIVSFINEYVKMPC